MKQGFVIPVYNHGKTAGPQAEKLARYGLPIIMVDDGSDSETKSCLAQAAAACPLVTVVTLEKNRGKGAAVIRGVEKARELGLSHVLQIDADGQHDIDRSGFFLEESAAHPEAVIGSRPEYDESVPPSRKNGRKVANTWTKIVTLSARIPEAMLGFRVYPVEPFLRLCRTRCIDRRMGFDIEILVRLYWMGTPMIFHPVRVVYPEDGISHFHVVRDNIRISWVFTRLFFGMLIRLPLLIRMRKKTTPSGDQGKGRDTRDGQSAHWSEYKEEAAGYWHIKLLFLMFRVLPVFFLRLCAFPVSFFYYLFSKRAREESRRFLEKITAVLKAQTPEKEFNFHPLGHILAFSLTLVEKVEAWGGKVAFDRIHFQEDDIGDLIAGLEKGQGALLICSHLGNSELLRALADYNRTGVSRNIPVTSIVDFSVTALFNRMIRELNPQSAARVISAGDVGPDTVILLMDRIKAGELVVIAGDRTSANTRNKIIPLPFLNEQAAFPYGPFILTVLLNAPAYFVFALRREDLSLSSHYDMHVHKSSFSFECPHREREKRTAELARSFAEQLEYHCKQHPYQWYNFYDFWTEVPADLPAEVEVSVL